MQGPVDPKEELKSPLSGGGTSNWKKWPNSCCSKAKEETVVPGIMGGTVASGLELGLLWKFSGVTTAQGTNLFLAPVKPQRGLMSLACFHIYKTFFGGLC